MYGSDVWPGEGRDGVEWPILFAPYPSRGNRLISASCTGKRYHRGAIRGVAAKATGHGVHYGIRDSHFVQGSIFKRLGLTPAMVWLGNTLRFRDSAPSATYTPRCLSRKKHGCAMHRHILAWDGMRHQSSMGGYSKLDCASGGLGSIRNFRTAR
jgi:hypothetical protein